MLFALLGLHAALAVVAPVVGRRFGRAVFLLCGLAPLATVAWVGSQASAILDGTPVSERFSWVSGLGVTVDLRLDAFGLVMVLLISGIGTLIFGYAHGYFSKPRSDLGKFAASLTGFAGAMLGVVLADNLLILFAFWELTSITSYLLIGFEDRRESARAAAQQALLVTGAGGLALLGGFVVIGQAAGTYTMSEVLAAPPEGALVNAALVLVLLGAFTKSAQAPFHTWLPGAMAAPTPVSAYLHSATMVKAGVYLIARFAPAFAAAGPWRPMVVTVGVATMLLGAYRALRQHDLKLLLAYGTISQLGFMVALFGAGTPKAAYAGVVLLLAHGIFKAALFMVVGIVDHGAHTRDLRRLDGIRSAMPAVAVLALVAAASMAGIPPLLGFISKEAAFEAFLGVGSGAGGTVALIGVVGASMLTFAYSARFVWGGFAAKPPGFSAGLERVGPQDTHRPKLAFAAPALLLGALTLLFGLVPSPVNPLVNEGASALNPAWEAQSLALWHGWNVALALSVLAVGVGLSLFVLRTRVERVQSAVPYLPGSLEAYHAAVNGLLAGAKRLTGVVQNGSLPVYLTIIVLTLVLVPIWPLWEHITALSLPPLADGNAQLWVGVAVLAAALATVAGRRRFTSVLLLGGVGYGVAVLFVLQGAPDLALTQLLFETLVVVLFVLVLRHLPTTFSGAGIRAYRWLRATIAAGVGLFVFAFALVAGSARTQAPVSEEYLARALPEGHGRNVVNVILVDFRALDTLGEIVVLLVAAVGIVSLVLASRLDGGRRAPEPAPEPGDDR